MLTSIRNFFFFPSDLILGKKEYLLEGKNVAEQEGKGGRMFAPAEALIEDSFGGRSWGGIFTVVFRSVDLNTSLSLKPSKALPFRRTESPLWSKCWGGGWKEPGVTQAWS